VASPSAREVGHDDPNDGHQRHRRHGAQLAASAIAQAGEWMMRNVRIKKRVGKKGTGYQVIYPDRKTGREVADATFPTRKAAEARKKEIENHLFNQTEFGSREGRTLGELLDYFLLDCQERHRRTVEQQAWHERWSMSGDTNRSYRDLVGRFLKPKLGDHVLIALDFDDCQKFVDSVLAEVTGPQARRAGETLRTVLRFGGERGWVISEKLIGLLPRLILPPKPQRRTSPTDEQIGRCFQVIYGPRRHKQSR
jgi:hypothetical protein